MRWRNAAHTPRPAGRWRGFTLVEVLVTIGVVGVAYVLVTSIFQNGVFSLTDSRMRVVAGEIANEQIEVLRNMPYDQLGTTTGWPNGSIPASQTIQRSGESFTVATRIDYVDDPFDGNVYGTIPGKPLDTVPNDYKRVDVTVTWQRRFATPVALSTLVVPKGMESASNSGALAISILDSGGMPVPQATIRITNTTTTPNIDITNTTDNDGNLQVLSLPPSNGTYHIAVSKSGYSSEQTYDPAVLPNPEHENLSVYLQDVTPATYYIDRVSTLNISTQGENCSAIGNVPLSLWGQKLIAHNPDVRKYSSNPPTDGNGKLRLTDLEWDNYTLVQTSGAYDVAGVIPPILLNILPNTEQSIALVLAPHTTNSLHVTTKDATDGTTITGATVHLTEAGYDESLQTGVGYLTQTDWSGGSGQTTIGDPTKYSDDDSQVDVSSTPGQVQLRNTITTSTVDEDFATTAREDVSATTADWNTAAGALTLAPDGVNYLSAGTAQSVNLLSISGKITAATLSAAETRNGQFIDYFLSADGGNNFESVVPGTPHTFVNTGNDLRFRVVMTTGDVTVTPTVDSLSVAATVVTYATSAVLTSSTFDTNTTSTDFRTINWIPVSQPAAVGADSVRFQVSANDDNSTWDFVGPDGTSASYFTVSGTDLPASLDGRRYLRYRLFLQTADPGASPVVSLATLGFTSGCVPPGQAFFPNLSATTYTLDIAASGYTTYSSPVTVNGATNVEIQMARL